LERDTAGVKVVSPNKKGVAISQCESRLTLGPIARKGTYLALMVELF
jgi:hypothetical protein